MIRKMIQSMLVFFIIELAMMIWIGSKLGIMTTISLILLSSVVGLVLAKEYGYGAIRMAQQQITAGQPPGQILLNGVLLSLGAVLLIFPGFLSDILGILILIPYTRKFFYQLVYLWIRKKAFQRFR